ncbi:hypothetical protein Mp_2g06420 [Marchantia polymorpha subsp. ruderalis]|uniref:Uncharacterized protein n=1 Tax=Marchantia polymorpha TaxID=3197 RepID=A0A2R6XDQ2_MARPO|nr:hypothetical protein MARPO_0021s0097 [Marchantia polymorpha]BBN01316.1 hypothetical protein Mp_2g06420 [Marchantia polymorpha subsp. ruderalis]|eukprot:PTQ44241.1 hypothetical protein MARPO_0021s0097 [Marchantia polymorpha]
MMELSTAPQEKRRPDEAVWIRSEQGTVKDTETSEHPALDATSSQGPIKCHARAPMDAPPLCIPGGTRRPGSRRRHVGSELLRNQARPSPSPAPAPARASESVSRAPDPAPQLRSTGSESLPFCQLFIAC